MSEPATVRLDQLCCDCGTGFSYIRQAPATGRRRLWCESCRVSRSVRVEATGQCTECGRWFTYRRRARRGHVRHRCDFCRLGPSVCVDCGQDFTYRKGASVPSRRLCKLCRRKRNSKCEVESRRRRANTRQGLGLCYQCDTPITCGQKYCDECAERFKARERKWHERQLPRKRPPRHCTMCGKTIPKGYASTCLECRFWARVEKRGEGECWIWTGTSAGPGYGKISSHGKQVYAHRLAWELANGPSYPSLFVLHKCDNRLCCNPAHLYLGTQADNVRDRDSRGRTARGDSSGVAKLNSQAVKVIRWAWGRGVKQARLAALFHVGPCNIWNIVHNRSWKHAI